MAREPLKCCCCVPLRPGLLAWAYIKLVLVLTFIGSLFTTRSWLKYFYHNPVYTSNFEVHQVNTFPVMLVYLLFTIIFIIGVHRESSKLLLTFLVYSIFEVILGVVGVVCELYNFVDMYYRQFEFEYYENAVLWLISPIVMHILLPIYVMVLIKSELKSLKLSRGGTRVVLDQPVAIELDII